MSEPVPTEEGLQLDTVSALSPAARDVGLARQFMSADLIAFGDGWERGVRAVRLQNDIISLDVIVDRALDICAARIRQLPIGWQSPTGVSGPWFTENSGFGTQRSFFGGLLTTCGLDHIGLPSESAADRFGYKARKSDSLPMHGRISGSPARLIAYGLREQSGALEAFVEGEVRQVSLFGENLVLRRRITISYSSARISVADAVTNEGYASSPLAVLYHVNVGWPVVSPTASLHLPIGPDRAAPNLRRPVRGSQERVSGFAALATEADIALAGIVNAHVTDNISAGLALRWRTAVMPTILQWDIANVGGNYAVGFEPTTRLSQPQSDGSVFPALEPGEIKELGIEIELLHGPGGLGLKELLRQ